VQSLYSITKGQQAIRKLSRAMSDRTGNLPLLLGIYPHGSPASLRAQDAIARDGTHLPLKAFSESLSRRTKMRAFRPRQLNITRTAKSPRQSERTPHQWRRRSAVPSTALAAFLPDL
jgi:hypothetical protein